MDSTLLNTDTLARVGIKLLPEEELEVAVELEDGVTEQLEQSHATLILTDKRLIRYSTTGHSNNVVSVGLGDVDSIEVNRTEGNPQWVWVGLVFTIGGALLATLSLLLMASPLSPLLMALSLALIGIVFMLTYIGGLRGDVKISAGLNDIRCRMKPKALDDMGVFVERFYELKLGGGNVSAD
jgi:VIT1/CCC1 family predicted Fe2+/Mn2+ transporter